ncbi:hypothetical protein NDU88_007332 [Pleurodeles waltl]|uniref:Prolactin receptor n=1 Tax=Pleurodeles waltl TaxID=8319 RepID=A0AAV7RSM7_PLEWA|nr:hypothetical protein NDU88_007332 [Pleurodeles waltl]
METDFGAVAPLGLEDQRMGHCYPIKWTPMKQIRREPNRPEEQKAITAENSQDQEKDLSHLCSKEWENMQASYGNEAPSISSPITKGSKELQGGTWDNNAQNFT